MVGQDQGKKGLARYKCPAGPASAVVHSLRSLLTALIVPHFALWVMSHVVPSPYRGVCGMAGGVLQLVSQVVPV